MKRKLSDIDNPCKRVKQFHINNLGIGAINISDFETLIDSSLEFVSCDKFHEWMIRRFSLSEHNTTSKLDIYMKIRSILEVNRNEFLTLTDYDYSLVSFYLDIKSVQSKMEKIEKEIKTDSEMLQTRLITLGTMEYVSDALNLISGQEFTTVKNIHQIMKTLEFIKINNTIQTNMDYRKLMWNRLNTFITTSKLWKFCQDHHIVSLLDELLMKKNLGGKYGQEKGDIFEEYCRTIILDIVRNNLKHLINENDNLVILKNIVLRDCNNTGLTAGEIDIMVVTVDEVNNITNIICISECKCNVNDIVEGHERTMQNWVYMQTIIERFGLFVHSEQDKNYTFTKASFERLSPYFIDNILMTGFLMFTITGTFEILPYWLYSKTIPKSILDINTKTIDDNIRNTYASIIEKKGMIIKRYNGIKHYISHPEQLIVIDHD